jgi:hypothetical protein
VGQWQGRVGQWQGRVGQAVVLRVKNNQAGVGSEQEIKKKWRRAERESWPQKGVGFFKPTTFYKKKVPAFLKIPICTKELRVK